MKKQFVILFLFISFILVSCSTDRTNDIDKIGKEMISYLNKGANEIFEITHTKSYKNEYGNYNCVFVFKPSDQFQEISNLSGDGMIYFDDKSEFYNISINFENLDYTKIQMLYYPLSACYLQLMSDNDKLFNVGSVENKKISLFNENMRTLYSLDEESDFHIKNGNYTSSIGYFPPSIISNDHGSIRIDIGK